MIIKEKDVEIGAVYHASSDLLVQPFQGEVMAKFTNAAILHITNYSMEDDRRVYDLNERVLVKYDDLSMV